MAGWRPQVKEPDILKGALMDYLRDRAGLVYLEPAAGSRSLGRSTVLVADGRKLVIELAMTPERQLSHTGRAALVFGIAGQAADQRHGYTVKGEAVLDVATRCFLALEVGLSGFELAAPS